MRSSSPREIVRLFAMTAVLVVSGMVFSGCSLLFPSGPERDPETGEIRLYLLEVGVGESAADEEHA